MGVQHVVVMGVSGTGKTTIGRLVAERLGAAFVEGDDLHPPANVEKMRSGVPLTDDDRGPWLRLVAAAMTEHAQAGRPTVVACSALRRAYRDVLRSAEGRVRFVHLAVPRPELDRRLAGRRGHFMPATLLESQLATLEPLGDDEDGLDVPVTSVPADTAEAVLQALGA
ncbi:gluconokinase [Cellulomonas fimi]|uniref:Gluconokinase n=1 Tax=Cellulomonas fimi (strain ATCC 484 / DSM 20113 / JCM 1341 / CCUG 24087 / LMG 16345 / NBRC 15513 / NCIMB 8980 / NCTC 7547 / NRS-133) TaxID=590998 RepID=F4H3R0_CELFA|nr:gluconokinase [Cellulomonas fimi]AEE47726.1 carbohydrate kinase, thermoresistant glucokinase family [Cellulomonas fimi ATCC 484]VEH36879.1 Thermoresistant gluconokinase [Cellulomonas fimi]